MCVLVTSPCDSGATLWSRKTSDGTEWQHFTHLMTVVMLPPLFPLSAHPPNVTTFFFFMNIWFLYLLTSWLNFFELFSLSISCLKLEPSLPLRWVVKFKGGLGKPCWGWFTSIQMMSQLKDWPCVHYAPAYLQIKYDGQNFFLFLFWLHDS